MSALPAGKKVVIGTSRADGEEPMAMGELYEHMDAWLNMVAGSFSPSSVEFINHFGSMNMKDSAQDDSDLMAKAESIGASLA